MRTLIIIWSVALLLLTSCGGANEGDQNTAKTQASAIEEQPLYYGIHTNGLKVVEKTVQHNEFLSNILLPFGVSYNNIDYIAKNPDLFDVRQMREGQPYSIIYDTDSSGNKAQYFIYEQNKRDFVIFNFAGDSVGISKGQKEVERQRREIAGIINSSLYQTLMDQHAPLFLVNKLESIYAWSLDFYRIQKGDRFKVIYDELFVDGEHFGIDSVRAAWFDYRGSQFYAIEFNQNGLDSYYDPEGKSLQKAFLQAPLEYSRISSRYSKRRFHPVLKRYKSHLGTDYAAPQGTPIRSTGDGVVIAATYTKGNGNYVKIRHNEVYTTQYLHMSKFAKGMKKGIAVKQGQVIGYVGSTGLATGPHVCYRFWKRGVQVDPFLEKLPPAFPVEEDQFPRYEKTRDRLLKELDGIEFPQIDSIRLSGPAVEAQSIPVTS